MVKGKYLIIGNGVSGMYGAIFIRNFDSEGNITILTNEMMPFYSRPLIIDVMTGRKRRDEIMLLDDKKHNYYGYDLKKGVTVSDIDIKRGRVKTPTGDFRYDKLLIATGAMPKKAGFDGEGVFYLRTVDDAEQIAAYLKKVKRAIVYGGGPVGIKAVYGLLSMGIHVDVIVSSPYILSRALDRRASILLQEIFERNGAVFYCKREINDIVWRRGLKGIVTDRGEEIPGDILIIGKGVEPDMRIARNAGITTDKGIITDGMMRTNIDNIFAAGDVAEVEAKGERLKSKGSDSPLTTVLSLWYTGASQGKIAGCNMAGQNRAHEGSVNSNSVEYFGVKCISMGVVEGGGYEETIFEEDNIYRKYLFNGEKLVGAVLLGNIEDAGLLLNAIKTDIPIKNSILQMHNPFSLWNESRCSISRGKPAIYNEVNMEVLF
jgi:nitrite reductase (NADH) large subunit